MIAAAQVCFGEQGYAKTRISDIAGRAEVSQGAFYRHFDGKDGIFLEALRPALEELAVVTRTDPSQGADSEALTPMLTAYLATYSRHRHLFKVTREAAALGEPNGFVEAWLLERAKFVRRLRRWLVDGADNAAATSELTGPAEDPASRHAEAIGSMIEQVAYVHFGLPTREPTDADVLAWASTLASLMVHAKMSLLRAEA